MGDRVSWTLQHVVFSRSINILNETKAGEEDEVGETSRAKSHRADHEFTS